MFRPLLIIAFISAPLIASTTLKFYPQIIKTLYSTFPNVHRDPATIDYINARLSLLISCSRSTCRISHSFFTHVNELSGVDIFSSFLNSFHQGNQQWTIDDSYYLIINSVGELFHRALLEPSKSNTTEEMPSILHIALMQGRVRFLKALLEDGFDLAVMQREAKLFNSETIHDDVTNILDQMNQVRLKVVKRDVDGLHRILKNRLRELTQSGRNQAPLCFIYNRKHVIIDLIPQLTMKDHSFQRELDIVSMMAEGGCDLNIKATESLLTYAIKLKRNDFAATLVEAGALITDDEIRSTVEMNNMVMLDFLLSAIDTDRKSDPYSYSWLDRTLAKLLGVAVSFDFEEIVRYLLKRPEHESFYTGRLLVKACHDYCVKSIPVLVDALSLDDPILNSARPILSIIRRSDSQTLHYLLQKPFKLDHGSVSFVHEAVRQGNLDLVKVLIHHNAPAWYKTFHDFELPVTYAYRHHFLDIFEFIITTVPSPLLNSLSLYHGHSVTLLQEAILRGDTRSVSLLLHHGADPTIKSSFSIFGAPVPHIHVADKSLEMSPLESAIRVNSKPIVDELLKYRPHITGSTSGDSVVPDPTPFLSIALSQNRGDIALSLLTADVSISPHDVFESVRKGFTLVVERMMERGGVDVNGVYGPHNETLLCVASSAGFDSICEVLMNAGADVKKKNGRGRTALDCAKGEKVREVLRKRERKMTFRERRRVVWEKIKRFFQRLFRRGTN